MFYKSPGRALQDLRGINTGTIMEKSGPLWTKWGQILTRYLSFVGFALKIVIFFLNG